MKLSDLNPEDYEVEEVGDTGPLKLSDLSESDYQVEEDPELESEESSMLDTLSDSGRGAAQGVSLGLADEIGAALLAGPKKLYSEVAENIPGTPEYTDAQLREQGFTGDIELTDLDPPNSYKITGSGNSPVGFASGEATVKLEDNEKGTNLIYEVEANVGGKIAQVGSRLIDMTAKKMADIFFGKFSELISTDDSTSSEQISEKKIDQTNEAKPKKQNQKILVYAAIAVAVAILIYSFL